METRKQRCVIVCHCMHIHMLRYHMQFVCLGFQHITLSQIVADTRILLARFTKYFHSVYTNWLLLPTVAICEDWTRRTYQKLRVWSERLRMLDAIWKVNMILGGFLVWWVEGIESWQRFLWRGLDEAKTSESLDFLHSVLGGGCFKDPHNSSARTSSFV